MNIRINFIFWKQGPLLPRLLARKEKITGCMEPGI